MFLPLELALRDFRGKYAGSVLGVGWSVVWPIINLCIYIIVFGTVIGARIPGKHNVWFVYGIYLSAGMIPWLFFSGVVIRISTVFLDSAHLIKKVPVVLWQYPLYILFSESITFGISLAILVGVAVFLEGTWPDLVLILSCSSLMAVLGYGLGLLFATLVVFLRDLKELVPMALQFWFWFTPIVYTIDILPAFFRKLMIWNPMFPVVEGLHLAFLGGETTFWASFWMVAVLAFVLVGLAVYLNRALEKDIRDLL